MSKLTVTVPRLNRRKVIPTFLPDKSNIAGERYFDDSFLGEEVLDVPNTALGKWYIDQDGYFYWGGGLKVIAGEPLVENLPDTSTQASFAWFKSLRIDEVWKGLLTKGKNVKVAILDTGFDRNNQFLSKNIIGHKIIIEAADYAGIELIIQDQSNDGHGNRTASLAGSDNAGGVLVGVAPEVELLIGKISINKELRNFKYILDGIDWAIKQGAEIISISYAYEDLLEPEMKKWQLQINSLLDNKNVLVFCSAGNSGPVQKIADLYPASFFNCISVGASDANNGISKITVLSSKTILHAPGESIESYGKNSILSPKNGTSFSTPIAAGIAALAVSYLKKKKGSWDKNQLLNILYQSGDAIDQHLNKKIINPAALMNLLKTI